MKFSTIFTVAAMALGASAAREGNSPEEIINGIAADSQWSRWPAVVHCTRGDVTGTGWDRSDAIVWSGPSWIKTRRDCKITWCNPDNGKCWFELKGDGGGYNWWQKGWYRDDKKLCYPRPCNQM
ncbi:hypothetical protein Dda_3582 [Drechslerella dactyloides]|uniref:Uncharacterized protein n=1 Tax=Drechslerella dactyloides TaxID=74499 RepID=A0AAD6NIL8_DREDA|nr:hypothetical protein Dda_3582 [Drechslerella dactyloides]